MRYVILFACAAVLVSMLGGCQMPARPQNVSASATPTPQAGATTATAATPSNDDVFDGNVIVKSDDEWRKQLTADQFAVLREGDTEPAYQNEYFDNHEHGTYYCAACHLKLFGSETKFESGTGWPSFFQPVNKKNVIEVTDRQFGMVRTEVQCARCKSHLGHVFDDGPKPTGLRYCMNSAALKFEKN